MYALVLCQAKITLIYEYYEMCLIKCDIVYIKVYYHYLNYYINLKLT
jgi:hypothetical protein